MEPRTGVAIQVSLYLLFPDQRDQPGPGGAGPIADLEERVEGVRPAAEGGMWRIISAKDPAWVLSQIAAVHWQHPVHVVYRTRGEDRWSHATVIGRTQGEEN